mgnify:CR=1 FL=1
MIIYKLEWTTQKDSNTKINQSEFYTKKEDAERKKIQLNEAASLIGFIGLGSWVTEIEVIEGEI